MATNPIPFLIRHADGREYELDNPTAYREQYMPQGFALVDPQPSGYARPDLGEKKPAKAKDEPKADKGDEPKDKDA